MLVQVPPQHSCPLIPGEQRVPSATAEQLVHCPDALHASPLGQSAADKHLHTPLEHFRLPLQDGLVPHSHAPFTQAFAFVPHGVQVPPGRPHSAAEMVSQTFPWQQPVGQLVVEADK